MISAYNEVLFIVWRHYGEKSCVITSCRHCKIGFLTAPSNRNRHDLLCPFGCRKNQKRIAANNRTKTYYASDYGKQKKKLINKRRYRQTIAPNHPDKAIKKTTSPFPGHLKFVFELIEGKKISLAQIIDLSQRFFKKWRQHPLDLLIRMIRVPPT